MSWKVVTLLALEHVAGRPFVLGKIRSLAKQHMVIMEMIMLGLRNEKQEQSILNSNTFLL